MKSGKGSPAFRAAKPNLPPPAEIALRGLAYLTRDEERLARFLAMTGLDAGDVRPLLADRGFHLAVLDHLAGDETLLLDFVAAEALPPESVGEARRALGGDGQAS